MPRNNESTFFKKPRIKGVPICIPKSSNLSGSQISEGLEQLTKGKEDLLWVRAGLLKDQFIQEACKAKGIPLA